MKRLLVFTFISVMLVSLVFSEEYDIRKLKWGMSFEEVQQTEGLGNNFYKTEDLLGIKVEVLFGCDNKGLYSVTYSTKERVFAGEAKGVMIKKYGEPKTDLDYSYLIKVKDILKKYPVIVTQALEKEDFSGLDKLNRMEADADERKILRNVLTKRAMWEYGNTVALLLDSMEGAVLSYWAKTYHFENKKKFDAFFEELKKKVPKKEKKKTEEGEKF